ncbi:unnamed protein product [Rotaria sp. Silwood2]|nr:unnamed protein product [Rotaria sp. Silwood2]CAF4408863.1 unnamed protein product [Rotaria sp. Silwood2]
MKAYALTFILIFIGTATSISLPDFGICIGRWEFFDSIKTKITIDWQILSLTNTLIAQFRPSSVERGFWYAFGLRFSPEKPIVEIVYSLRWPMNDSELFWDIFNVTETNVTIMDRISSIIDRFQNWITSGLLIVRPPLNVDDVISFLSGNQCMYLVYMRGHFNGDQPLPPDEVIFNQSLCITCQAIQIPSTSTPIINVNSTTIAEGTSILTTSSSSPDFSATTLNASSSSVSTTTSGSSSSVSATTINGSSASVSTTTSGSSSSISTTTSGSLPGE